MCHVYPAASTHSSVVLQVSHHLHVNSSCLHSQPYHYVLKYAIWDLLVTYILVHRVNDRLSATMKLQMRLYKDRKSAANSSDSEG